MKILYVATAYAGLDSLLLNGATRIDGLPPQTKVLRALVERGDEVDMVIHIDGEARPLDIACDWLKRLNVIETVFRKQGLMEKLGFIRRMNSIVKRYLAEGNYDFVYLVGDACTRGARYARLEGVPCGQRLFGSYGMWMLEHHGKIWCLVCHYPRMAPFLSRSRCLSYPGRTAGKFLYWSNRSGSGACAQTVGLRLEAEYRFALRCRCQRIGGKYTWRTLYK